MMLDTMLMMELKMKMEPINIPQLRKIKREIIQ
jgi:hypothetical protein